MFIIRQLLGFILSSSLYKELHYFLNKRKYMILLDLEDRVYARFQNHFMIGFCNKRTGIQLRIGSYYDEPCTIERSESSIIIVFNIIPFINSWKKDYSSMSFEEYFKESFKRLFLPYYRYSTRVMRVEEEVKDFFNKNKYFYKEISTIPFDFTVRFSNDRRERSLLGTFNYVDEEITVYVNNLVESVDPRKDMDYEVLLGKTRAVLAHEFGHAYDYVRNPILYKLKSALKVKAFHEEDEELMWKTVNYLESNAERFTPKFLDLRDTAARKCAMGFLNTSTSREYPQTKMRK